jgi:hypothetical protein
MMNGRGGYPLGEIFAYLGMGGSFSNAAASLAARRRRAPACRALSFAAEQSDIDRYLEIFEQPVAAIIG